MTTLCDLVLPCRDEALALPGVLAAVPAGMRVIVVDNGSTDGTAAVARELGATVVSESRPGYGAAVHAGVEAATAPLVAVMDGDGSMDPGDLAVLVAEVAAGRSDMAVGRRRPTMPGAWPWHARLGNVIVLARLRARTGVVLHDIAPMRVCRRQALLDLGVLDRRFGYPVELLAKAQQAGWVLTEHDVAYGQRTAGTSSKVSGSLSGSLRAARDFVKVMP